MGEIIARNMLNRLKLLIKLLLLHLVGCLCYCISDARSHKHQNYEKRLLAPLSLSVHPSAWLGSHWTDFHEISYLRSFRKYQRLSTKATGVTSRNIVRFVVSPHISFLLSFFSYINTALFHTDNGWWNDEASKEIRTKPAPVITQLLIPTHAHFSLVKTY